MTDGGRVGVDVDAELADESSEKPHQPTLEDFSAAALFAQPFMILFTVHRFRHPPTDISYANADPIIKLLPREPMMWLTPLFSLALTIVLLALAWPSLASMIRALLWTAVGLAVSVGSIALMVKLHGSRTLPPYISLEMSMGTGLTFGPMAAFLEETVFRLGVLPLIYLHLAQRSRFVAVLLASVVTGVVFAALHEAGSVEAFHPLTFAVRLTLFGTILSLTALLLKPSFSIVTHCAIAVIIPLVFANA